MDVSARLDNGKKSTPYEEMKALQDRLNEGVRRGERWTMQGKRSIPAYWRPHEPAPFPQIKLLGPLK